MTEPTKACIVVAEDDMHILNFMVNELTEAGFDIVAVADGVAALAAIEANPPRLAILDIQMPGMSGIEVLSKVRANATISDLEVILLTAYSTGTDAGNSFASGVSNYVTRTFSPRALLQRVNVLTA